MQLVRGLLEPAIYNAVDVNRRMRQLKTKQKHYHDRNSTKELPPLLPGEHVRVRPEQGSKVWTPAVVKEHHNAPRSYIVDTGRRQLRRNRVALRRSTEAANQSPKEPAQPDITCSEAPTRVNQPEPPNNTEGDIALALPTPPPETPRCPRAMQSAQAEATHSASPNKTTRSGRNIKAPIKLDL